jgi:hypothetical protein
MDTLVIDPVQQREKLQQLRTTIQVVRQSEQAKIDGLLDQINATKSSIAKAQSAAQVLPDSLRELFSFSEVSAEVLVAMQKNIRDAETASRSMMALYVRASRIYQSLGLDRKPLERYKETAIIIKEIAVDLRHRFIDMDDDAEFHDLLEQLSEVA